MGRRSNRGLSLIVATFTPPLALYISSRIEISPMRFRIEQKISGYRERRLAHVLVTGGAGFIGRHVVRLLRAQGRAVRVLDLKHDPASADDGVEAVIGSVLDAPVLGRAFNGVDTVFHLAGNPQLWAPDTGAFDRINRDGLEAVLAAAQSAGVARIVHTSSEVVLKDWRSVDTTPMIEPETLPPVGAMAGPYSRSKHAADEAAMAAARAGAPVVVVHPTIPIGPGDFGMTPPTAMIARFLRGDLPAILDSGFNFVPVEDVARGHLLAAEKGRIGARYILGGHNLRLSEMLTRLAAMTGRRPPRFRAPYGVALAVAKLLQAFADHVTRRPPIAPVEGVRLARAAMLFDCARARDELGFVAGPLDPALKRCADWLRDEGQLG